MWKVGKTLALFVPSSLSTSSSSIASVSKRSSKKICCHASDIKGCTIVENEEHGMVEDDSGHGQNFVKDFLCLYLEELTLDRAFAPSRKCDVVDFNGYCENEKLKNENEKGAITLAGVVSCFESQTSPMDFVFAPVEGNTDETLECSCLSDKRLGVRQICACANTLREASVLSSDVRLISVISTLVSELIVSPLSSLTPLVASAERDARDLYVTRLMHGLATPRHLSAAAWGNGVWGRYKHVDFDALISSLSKYKSTHNCKKEHFD
jgi:hypothetical protein